MPIKTEFKNLGNEVTFLRISLLELLELLRLK